MISIKIKIDEDSKGYDKKILMIIETHIPTINNMYTQNKYGRRVVSSKHRKFKNAIHRALKRAIGNRIFFQKDEKLQVDIFVYFSKRGRDINNILKPLIDSLEKVAFYNDSQIYKLTIQKEAGAYKQNKEKISLKIEKISNNGKKNLYINNREEN